MSDLMLLGILRMPMPEVPNPDEVVAYTQFVSTARQAAARIEELERELAEAKRDAERYRWLRNRHYKGGMLGVWRETKEGVAIVDGWLSGAELDKAIDAAMKEDEK